MAARWLPTLSTAWQAALEDVGPDGADKGKGGKYLILPPGYKRRCRTVTSRCNLTHTAGSRCFARI